MTPDATSGGCFTKHEKAKSFHEIIPCAHGRRTRAPAAQRGNTHTHTEKGRIVSFITTPRPQKRTHPPSRAGAKFTKVQILVNSERPGAAPNTYRDPATLKKTPPTP